MESKNILVKVSILFCAGFLIQSVNRATSFALTKAAVQDEERQPASYRIPPPQTEQKGKKEEPSAGKLTGDWGGAKNSLEGIRL